MSLGSGFLENIPHFTFTPTEHQVECVKVAGDRNLTFVLTKPQEKSFLVLMLVREVAQCVRSGAGKAALLLYSAEQVSLWTSFLTRMTDLKVSGLEECWEHDTGQIVASAGVLVTTHDTFATVVSRKHLGLDQCRLVIVDNVQASLQTPSSLMSLYNSVARNQAPRLVAITPNILTSNTDQSLSSLPQQLSRLGALIPATVEAACEVATQLRYLARPKEIVITYSVPDLDTQTSLELSIRNMLEQLKVWIIDQNYSLYDTYGDEFGDLIAEIPDPTAMPLQIISDFLGILSELGVWCADRAALILMIKIDKLKTREKYERHFLLLSVLFSVMVRIRKLCDDMYGDMTDVEKMAAFSRPKLARLVELLLCFSPGPQTFPPAEAGKEKESSEQEPPPPTRGGRRGGGRRLGQVPEDPDTMCSLVVVNSAFSAKILYHFLKDLSRSRQELSYLCPQYAVQDPLPSDPRDVDNERKKQEEALRRFRMRECNILVSSSVLEEGIDFVKCNLVIMFDPPASFHRYIYAKVKCKSVGGSLVHLSSDTEQLLADLRRYKCLESSLLAQCTNQASKPQEDAEADSLVHLCPGYPSGDGGQQPPLSLSNAILVLNRYCAKLPSDTFTRLTPSWTVEPASSGGHYCVLFLPINSPLKRLVVGAVMPSPSLARRSAAYTACVALHEAGELDGGMMPVGKESLLTREMINITKGNEWNGDDTARPGTTKRRQYYYKKVAKCLLTEQTGGSSVNGVHDDAESEMVQEASDVHKFYEKDEDEELKQKYDSVDVPESVTYSLYVLDMRLTCPIPEEQNTRGRRIHDPADSDLRLGLLLPSTMPPVPSFPIYTRSGEVMVSVVRAVETLALTRQQLAAVYKFHMFTFSSVLRLEKYPMVFSPVLSDNSVVVVPIRSGDIDWSFLQLITSLATRRLRYIPDQEREQFQFRAESYADAVIMPWYRNQDHPQYFYVAEICDHLSPASDFPGQGFETFSKYYSTKYSINIQNSSQPLLDVDHTSARLNFLTPRYVNRKGIALPTSSEETKRNKRENLEQKQILVPELCAVHPFPASLWRQTVSLPCILYRLNGLLISDQIRRHVATDMRLGLTHVPQDHTWPALSFGWTLADVVSSGKTEAAGDAERKPKRVMDSESANREEEMGEFGEWSSDMMAGDDMNKVADKLMNKLAEEERMVRKKKMEIGMWTNEMAAPDMPAPGLEGKAGGGADWGKMSDDEDEEIDMAGIELPDNLTFINSKGVMGGVEGKTDWVTGIQAKNFRVGSPTFFSGSGHMAGLMDDLEGYSCSDSEESWAGEELSDGETVEQQGGARIEFHGDNVAETIEGEEESEAREERVARDRDQEASMVRTVDWDPASLVVDEAEEASFDEVEIVVQMIGEKDEVCVKKPSEVIKASAVAADDRVSGCELETPIVDQDTVLRHMNLAPDLDLVPAPAPEDWGVIPWPGIDPDTDFSFDEQPRLEEHSGPSPSLILQVSFFLLG